jgi:excinuclease ABC subunit C
MANTNARQLFDEQDKKSASWKMLAESLQKKLRLDGRVETIECVDISNISGTDAVGSLVRFSGGEPDKSGYRHYRITSVRGPDDYAMMAETIRKRFDKSPELTVLPDIFMVDGGKGQLAIAEAIIKELGLENQISLLGIAKERADEGEKIYRPGRKNPIILPGHSPVLLYLMRVRDEAHRFGITFHRSLRKKRSLTSTLDQIPGVGAERKKRLLKSIGSLKKISQAGIAELQEVEGIGEELARQIHSFFNQP